MPHKTVMQDIVISCHICFHCSPILSKHEFSFGDEIQELSYMFISVQLCFTRQFWSSINWADYTALRFGFISVSESLRILELARLATEESTVTKER